jgi:rubrerythrin
MIICQKNVHSCTVVLVTRFDFDFLHRAIAEAAYRSVVLAGGKTQRSLTAGWEVLGLDRSAAERIFAEEQKEGFISEREAMYGGQTRKYDKYGRQIDEAGKLANPEEADENLDVDDDEDSELASSGTNVFECGECGFTLFVAQGRESKFYGSGFKCPECGAPKKKFKARDDVNAD